MSDILKLQLPISLQDILKIWARQAGFFEKSIPSEAQEIKYMNAMMELLGMLAKHHEEMDDSNFIRSFRFFKDAGLTKRLNSDTTLFKRAAKLEGVEPDTTTPTPIIQPSKLTPCPRGLDSCINPTQTFDCASCDKIDSRLDNSGNN